MSNYFAIESIDKFREYVKSSWGKVIGRDIDDDYSEYTDFFDITAVDASPDGLFNGDTQMSFYRNRALVTVKDLDYGQLLYQEQCFFMFLRVWGVLGGLTRESFIWWYLASFWCVCDFFYGLGSFKTAIKWRPAALRSGGRLVPT